MEQCPIIEFSIPSVEKYRKMQKILPPHVLQQRMSIDGFSSAQITSFLAGEAVKGPVRRKEVESAKQQSKYVKMLQMFPEDAVRQRMTVDGWAMCEIDLFFTQARKPFLTLASEDVSPNVVETAPNKVQSSSSTEISKPVTEKYRRMRQVHDEAVVRQRMSVDGFSPVQIACFMVGEAVPGPEPVKEARSAKQEAKYVKMMEMGMPAAAVRQRMRAAGWSENETDAFLEQSGGRAAVSEVDGNVSDRALEKYRRMRQVHDEAVVRQRMSVDGFSPVQIACFMVGEAVPGPEPVKEARSAKQEAKYVKMMEMGMPAAAVRQRMRAAGWSEKDICNVDHMDHI